MSQCWMVNRLSNKSQMGALLVVTLLVGLLSGCGFHLRGLDTVGQSQFKSVQLENLSAVSSEMQKALRRQLRTAGVTVMASGAEVQIALKATQFQVTRTAYSGRGDTTAELLKMSQAFSATLNASDTRPEQMIVTDQVSTYRDRQIETTALLASDRELQSIKREMASILARQLMDRVNRALLKIKPTIQQGGDQASVLSNPTSSDSLR
ncbi:MAG: LPS-assembly lipoprotein [Thiomicrorhabdus sp.]|nr:MAG: LPS-assembly lipoprotein [Thiomicrorhabdus sp.]